MQDLTMDTNLCIRLTMKKLGLRRKVDPTALEEEADTELLHVSKDILDTKVIRHITSVLSHAKTHVRDHRAFPVKVLRGGIYPLPVMLMDEVSDFLTETNTKVQALAAEFAEGPYVAAKADARKRLEPVGLWDETEYPSKTAVAKAFGLKWNFITIEVPQVVKSVSAVLYAKEKDKLEHEFIEMRKDMRAILRGQMATFVNNMLSILKPDESGKKRVIRHTLTNRLADFCAVFPFRNIDGDQSLEAEVQKMRALLSDMDDVEALRSSDVLRDHVAGKLELIATEVNRLADEAPIRRFRLANAQSVEAA